MLSMFSLQAKQINLKVLKLDSYVLEIFRLNLNNSER